MVAVLGSTFDGSYEPVADICAALDRHQAETGLDVPVHVDGASGGFVAPFIDPDLEWDFRLPRVQSINASGHKYGLVYPGVGWAIWRTPDALPEDLVFHVNYLGGDMPTFALNFSRPGNQVAAQYYNFIRLGLDGYRASSRRRATWRSTRRRPSPSSDRSGCSPTAASCPSSPSRSTAPPTGPTRCSTSRSGCATAAGWCPAYTFPENRRTSRPCASSCATACPATSPTC